LVYRLGAIPVAVIEPTAGVITVPVTLDGAAPTKVIDPDAGCIFVFTTETPIEENGAPEKGKSENITELPSDSLMGW
jgi:hypothetical protein